MRRRNSQLNLFILFFLLFAIGVVGSPLSRKQTVAPAIELQDQDSTVLGFQEFLGYVKRHHPIAKQADLLIAEGQANLLRAQGGFDPKIEVDYRRKDFKGTEYYDELSGVFKIPTWYGVEFKAGAERNEGEFLDPSLTVPEDGLFSAGVKVNVLQGMWINDRMATLRKARLFEKQTIAERTLAANDILYQASLAYFDWWKAVQEVKVYAEILEAARLRERGIIISAREGDKAAIDTVEAGIATQTRLLGLEQARVDEVKNRLQLATYLWLDGVPVELQDNVYPEKELLAAIDVSLGILGSQLDDFTLDNHPKIVALNLKLDQLDVDRELKANKLLPKITAEYNFITPDWDQVNTLNQNNYKAGLTFAYPIFTRQERGDLRLARIKIDDARYGLQSESLILRNKVAAVFAQLDGYGRQQIIVAGLATGTQRLLDAEIRKFDLGDSSLFLINSREVKFIETRLKQLEIELKLYNTKADLFKSLVLLPEDL